MNSSRIYLILLLQVFAGMLHAQLIENINCQAFTDEPFFDIEFIRQNKIKSITGEIKTKGNLEVIKDPKLVSRYEFDSLGRLILQYNSFNGSESKDTTFINYIYDSKGNIITKRTNDAYGFFSYNFEFDENNRITLKTYCREENIGKDRYHFEPGKQFTIVKETYSYLDRDSILTKSIYNNHDRIYQTDKFFYNEHELLTKLETQYVINKKKAITEFSYTDQGKVSEKIYYRDYKNKAEFEKWVYQYDELGNLTYIDYYKGETHITHQEILYNPSNFSLKALLVQDVASNFIKIIKFTTEFAE